MNEKKVILILGALVVLTAIAAGIMSIPGVLSPQGQVNPYMVTLSNQFIDVNGDGHLDYVYEAKVVLNRGGVIPGQVPPQTMQAQPEVGGVVPTPNPPQPGPLPLPLPRLPR